jgi:hypothetical protein
VRYSDAGRGCVPRQQKGALTASLAKDLSRARGGEMGTARSGGADLA